MLRRMAQVVVPAGLVCSVALASVGRAQGMMPNPATAPNPLTTAVGMLRGNFQDMITKSADEMPEANYAFRPTKDVRTFGEILNHVADASYMFCSTAKGEANPHPGPESGAPNAKMPTSKADIMTFLKGAFDYCNGVYAGTTDAQLNDQVDFFGGKSSKLFVLALNASHDGEHYGNLVTYLRIKGLVPPSTQQQMQMQRQMQQQKQNGSSQ